MGQHAGAFSNDIEHMSPKLPLPLKVPPDVWKWIRAEAAQRRMPVGNYALELLRRGIVDQTIEDVVRQSRLALDGPSREILRNVLVVRFLNEAMLGSGAASPLLQQATARADAELAKICPPEG